MKKNNGVAKRGVEKRVTNKRNTVCEPGSPFLGTSPAPLEEKFTYEDYCRWPEGERWELIDGVAYAMASPNQAHQETLGNVFGALRDYFKGKPCKVFVAPFDVRLAKQHENEKTCSTVVQPDVMVVCDKKKLDGKGVVGAPDLVVEIVSPSNVPHDLIRKLNLYELHGVREYWLIHPTEKTVMVFALLPETGRYGRPNCFADRDAVVSAIFPELVLPGPEIFPEEETDTP